MLPRLPAPHLIVRDFLPAEQRDALLAWTIGNEARFQSRQVKDTVGEGVRKDRLDDLGPLAPVFSDRIAAEYKDWIRQLRVSAFELGRLELRIGAYNDGSHFSFHIDSSSRPEHPESTRLLSAVYYYFREPRAFSGGHIRLFELGAGPGSEACKAISPEQNMLLVFPSWVGHDVTRVQCPTHNFADSRFAVNCWLHRQTPTAQASV